MCEFVVYTGFGDRLLGEVKQLAPKDVKIRVRRGRMFVVVWLLDAISYYDRHSQITTMCNIQGKDVM